MSKTLTLAATSLAGLVLGAGIGVAAAGQDPTPTRPERAAVTSMDEMHAAMGEHMGDADHASMMGSMGSMMSGMGADMPGIHSEHHPGTKG